MTRRDAPVRSVLVLRRGLFGYRRRDVVDALEAQRRQIDALAESVDRLWKEKERAWHANHAAARELLVERSRFQAAEAEDRARAVADATTAGIRELSTKLDALLDLRERGSTPQTPSHPRRPSARRS